MVGGVVSGGVTGVVAGGVVLAGVDELIATGGLLLVVVLVEVGAEVLEEGLVVVVEVELGGVLVVVVLPVLAVPLAAGAVEALALEDVLLEGVEPEEPLEEEELLVLVVVFELGEVAVLL